jgi:hypothetical protein
MIKPIFPSPTGLVRSVLRQRSNIPRMRGLDFRMPLTIEVVMQ